MAIRDKAVLWFLQKYVIPRSQIIDKPGFIAFKLSYKTSIYSRQVLIPESLFINLERKVIDEHGKAGEQLLYSSGKKFGYRFAAMSNVINVNETAEKDFLRYVDVLSKFVEGTYARKIVNRVDIKKSLVNFNFDDFIVCNKTGLGYMFSSGGIAGIWSRMICNPEIEAFQDKCQGRGDEQCNVVSAPADTLKEMGYNAMKETGLAGLEMEANYRNMNEIRPVRFARNSIRNYIESGVFGFDQGIISYKGNRYFIVESSLNYMIEMALKGLKGGPGMLFNIAFDYGKSLPSGINKPKFITDFMSALGWGDVVCLKRGGDYEVCAGCFPWTKWYKDTDYAVFRGMVSGILSSGQQGKIVLKNHKTQALGSQMNLICRE